MVENVSMVGGVLIGCIHVEKFFYFKVVVLLKLTLNTTRCYRMISLPNTIEMNEMALNGATKTKSLRNCLKTSSVAISLSYNLPQSSYHI